MLKFNSSVTYYISIINNLSQKEEFNKSDAEDSMLFHQMFVWMKVSPNVCLDESFIKIAVTVSRLHIKDTNLAKVVSGTCDNVLLVVQLHVLQTHDVATMSVQHPSLNVANNSGNILLLYESCK